MTARAQTCANCRHWQRGYLDGVGAASVWRADGEMGDCRLHAPEARNGFPFTWAFMWCGEHEGVEPGLPGALHARTKTQMAMRAARLDEYFK